MATEKRTVPGAAARRMSPEFWAVIGIGVTIFVSSGAGQLSIRSEIRELRDDRREDIAQVREDVAEVREDVAEVREEVQNLHTAVITLGKTLGERLAPIEQALSVSPMKITPDGEE